MYKRQLINYLQRKRGSHAMPNLFGSVEKMSEAEAKDWLTMLKNIDYDAESKARQAGRRAIMQGRW